MDSKNPVDPESLELSAKAFASTGIMFSDGIGLTGMVQGVGTEQELLNVITFYVDVDGVFIPYNFGLTPDDLRELHRRFSELIPLMNAEEERLRAVRN